MLISIIGGVTIASSALAQSAPQGSVAPEPGGVCPLDVRGEPPTVGGGPVLIFEVLLNATSMFSHSNVRMPLGLDRALRWFVVTPDMHRVHHSILSRETNSNFGFNVPWWDRLFGTYRPQPAAGHETMTIGIEQFRDPRELGLDRMLLHPLRGDTGRYPLGWREGER